MLLSKILKQPSVNFGKILLIFVNSPNYQVQFWFGQQHLPPQGLKKISVQTFNI